MPTIDMPLAELREYTGSSPRPTDFDEYWNAAERELDALDTRGFREEWVPARFQVNYARCWEVYFDGVRGARLHAKCVMPRGPGATSRDPEGGTGGLDRAAAPMPALFRFHGYTMHAGDWSSLLPYAAAGIAVFALDVRGQGGESTDPGGLPGNTQRGHIVRGVEGDPEDLFYRQVFLDTAAVVRMAAAHPEIDADRLGATGASQGGALTLACAALEPRIRAAWAVYPFLSDYRRVWDLEGGESAYEELRHWLKRRDPRHEHIEEFFTRLGYIDVQHLAERVIANTVVVTGLMDEICPPSSQFAVYNRLTRAVSRRMTLYPDFGHESLPDAPDLALQWFVEQLGPGDSNGGGRSGTSGPAGTTGGASSDSGRQE